LRSTPAACGNKVAPYRVERRVSPNRSRKDTNLSRSELAPSIDATAEFDRQLATLERLGYPALAGVTLRTFRKHINALKPHVTDLPAPREDALPFVIIVRSEWVDAPQSMALVVASGRQGFTEFDAEELSRFRPIEGIDLPEGPVYLAVDVDAGASSLNMPPDDAAPGIERAGRSFVTIDEGVALLTHYPDMLKTMNAFSLYGSRCGDRRVPAMWTSRGAPRLGWCWAGAPHTWMGTASLGARLPARQSRS